MRVLVVDNEPDVGAMLRDVLLEFGHQPEVVHSAPAAVIRLEAEPPDVVLLELHLPGMSGLDFMRLSPVREAAVPIVTISGGASEDEARESLRLGAIDFLDKPFGLGRLGQVLELIELEGLAAQPARPWAERRRGRRVRVTFPVHVRAEGGKEWHGRACDLSRFGVLIAGGVAAPAGAPALLALSLPDGRRPMRMPCVLVRAGASGFAYSFVTVGAEDDRRLTRFTSIDLTR